MSLMFPLGAGGGNVLTGNTLWVDAVNGNDTTAVVGNLSKPYKTLLAARTAATSGQTIIVLPGTYNERNLLKDGVNWHFMMGARVVLTTPTGVWDAIFDDSSTGINVPVICNITGDGYFEVDTGESALQTIINLQNIGSKVNFRAHQTKVHSVANSYDIYTDGVSGCNIEVDYVNSDGRCYLNLAGYVNVKIQKIVAAGVVQIPIGGGSTVWVDVIEANSPDDVSYVAYENSSRTGAFSCRSIRAMYDFTIQGNSHKSTTIINDIDIVGYFQANNITGIHHLEIKYLRSTEAVILQSTGTVTTDFFKIDDVRTDIFRININNGSTYQFGRVLANYGQVRVVNTYGDLARFHCDDLRALSGTNIDGGSDFGLIYVRNNSNTKNIVISGSYRVGSAAALTYPLLILGSNNNIKLANGTVLVAGAGATNAIYAPSAQDLKINGTVIVNKDKHANVTLTYGELLVNAAVD